MDVDPGAELFLMLAKHGQSGNDGCPAVYIEEADGEFIIQGPEVTPEEFAQLKNVLPGEAGVRISIEVVRAALAKYDAGVRHPAGATAG